MIKALFRSWPYLLLLCFKWCRQIFHFLLKRGATVHRRYLVLSKTKHLKYIFDTKHSTILEQIYFDFILIFACHSAKDHVLQIRRLKRRLYPWNGKGGRVCARAKVLPPPTFPPCQLGKQQREAIGITVKPSW